jgi:hypothetical protein
MTGSGEREVKSIERWCTWVTSAGLLGRPSSGSSMKPTTVLMWAPTTAIRALVVNIVTRYAYVQNATATSPNPNVHGEISHKKCRVVGTGGVMLLVIDCHNIINSASGRARRCTAWRVIYASMMRREAGHRALATCRKRSETYTSVRGSHDTLVDALMARARRSTAALVVHPRNTSAHKSRHILT